MYGRYISYWSQPLPATSFTALFDTLIWDFEIVITENKNTSRPYILLATGCGSNQNSIEIKLRLLPALWNILWTNCRYCTHILSRIGNCISWHYVGLLRRRELDIGRYSKPGLASFNPQEDHILLNDSPEGRTCVYIYQKVGDLIN
jgi:hypothetical protein